MPIAPDTTSQKPPGILQRAVQAVAYTITGVSNAWMGPNQPLPPLAPPETKGRRWDYPVAYNLNYVPRSGEQFSFTTLRNFANNCSVLQSVIQTRIDQMVSQEFIFRPKETEKGMRPTDSKYRKRIDIYTEFFKQPDRRLEWVQWLAGILDQHYVYDAVALYRVKNRGGAPYAFRQLDASKIKVLIDADGNTPSPPNPAYQQILKGLPAADYATYQKGDLHYFIKNYRADYAYGFPVVAQIASHIQMSIYRVREQSAYYNEGNRPNGLMEGAESLTADQISMLQEYMDSLFSGNIEQRSHVWWVPNGTKYVPFGKELLFDAFDEWLARVICYAFSVPPTPFIKANNRATAESAAEEAEAEGLRPTMKWVAQFMNRILVDDFGETEVEFCWVEDQEFDPVQNATINNIYSRIGAVTIDEIRDDLGRTAFGGAASLPMFATANGWIPIDPVQPMQAGLAPQNLVPGKLSLQGQPVAQAKSEQQQATEKSVSGSLVFIRRPLINIHDLQKWAKENGLSISNEIYLEIFNNSVASDVPEMDSMLPIVLVEKSNTSVEVKNGQVLIKFKSDELFRRRTELVAKGFSFSSDDELFIAIDIFSSSADKEVTLYKGQLLFGAEELYVQYDFSLLKLSREEVDQAASEAQPPTDKQKQAGNYKKGHIHIHGLRISIETPKGAVRSGFGKDGKIWSVVQPQHYGDIKSTNGADGDSVDVYVGPNPNSKDVWVIDQADADTGKFDEHKAMLGYDSWSEAQADYTRAFSDGRGHQRIGAVQHVSIDRFKTWLKEGDTTQPVKMNKRVSDVDIGDVLALPDPLTGEQQAFEVQATSFDGQVQIVDALGFTHWIDPNEKVVDKSVGIPFLAEGAKKQSRTGRITKAKKPDLHHLPPQFYDDNPNKAAELKIYNTVLKVFHKTQLSVAKQLRAKLKKADSEDYDAIAESIVEELDLDGLLGIVEIHGMLDEVASETGERSIKLLGYENNKELVETVDSATSDWAKERAAELVGKRYDSEGNLVEAARAEYRIDESTRTMLRQVIADSLREGIGEGDLVDRISDISEGDFYPFSEERAETIAQTEVIRASSQGLLIAARESERVIGEKIYKTWYVSEDEGVCDDCEGNANEGPIPQDENFSSGDDASPAHPNCRCAIALSVEEEKRQDREESDQGGSDDQDTAD